MNATQINATIAQSSAAVNGIAPAAPETKEQRKLREWEEAKAAAVAAWQSGSDAACTMILKAGNLAASCKDRRGISWLEEMTKDKDPINAAAAARSLLIIDGCFFGDCRTEKSIVIPAAAPKLSERKAEEFQANAKNWKFRRDVIPAAWRKETCVRRESQHRTADEMLQRYARGMAKLIEAGHCTAAEAAQAIATQLAELRTKKAAKAAK